MRLPYPRFLGRDDVFVIAEIGGNHEGDIAFAERLVADAIESGAHAIKFQSYSADKLVSNREDPSRHAHFRKFEFEYEQYVHLAKLVTDSGRIFMSSLWDLDSLEALNPYIPIHKVGSGDLTNVPMLEALARKNKPLILSTAMATLEEVRFAVQVVESVNPALVTEGNVAILHCVAMYGEPKDEYSNLLALRVLQEAFPHLPVGYSDHTVGTYVCELAVAMGARILELHFTNDKTRAFRDHAISVDKEEMADLLRQCDRISSILGTFEKRPVAAIETPQRIREFRRAVYLTRDLPAGTRLTEEMITTLRPNNGVDARLYHDVVGSILTRDKQAFEALSPSDLGWDIADDVADLLQ